MSSYASPRSPLMTITSTTIATPITVTPILENGPETWGYTRVRYRLGFIDLDYAYGLWLLWCPGSVSCHIKYETNLIHF